jgi:phenylacetate-coenzyme A ligase PaaK-like adenylate-forming protein
MNAIRLRQILLDALEYVPFYRQHWQKAGVDLTRVYSAAHLEFLPVVRKADLLACPPEQRIDERFLRATLRGEAANGAPFEMPIDKQAMSRRRWRFVRALLDVGYSPGERMMLITEPPFPTGAMFVRWTYVDRRAGDGAVFAAYAKTRPQVLYGPLSSLVQLANCTLASPEVKWRPRLVISTAEQLTDANRALLESAFSARVADFYGVGELGLVGYSVPGLSGYKLIPRDFHIETLPLAKGTDLERLIVTDLGGGVMPLIRFDTDDLVRRDRSRRGAPIVQVGRHMETLRRVLIPHAAVGMNELIS